MQSNLGHKKIVPYHELSASDLIVDCVYCSRRPYRHKGHEVLAKLLKVGNSGGIRVKGKGFPKKIVVLYSDQKQEEWPDEFNFGELIYYGDSRPGKKIVGLTKPIGNRTLNDVYSKLLSAKREQIPPIFSFLKVPNENDIIFKGLAIPEGSDGEENAFLEPYKKFDEARDQIIWNFKARFKLLEEVDEISRQWLHDINKNRTLDSDYCPGIWRNWVLSQPVP